MLFITKWEDHKQLFVDGGYEVIELVRNLVAHGDAREGKWRGNWRMEWVASTLTPPPNLVYPALLKLMLTLWLPAVDWTDAPTDLNGFVRLGERRNLVCARVPSRSAQAITQRMMECHKKGKEAEVFIYVLDLCFEHEQDQPRGLVVRASDY